MQILQGDFLQFYHIRREAWQRETKVLMSFEKRQFACKYVEDSGIIDTPC